MEHRVGGIEAEAAAAAALAPACRLAGAIPLPEHGAFVAGRRGRGLEGVDSFSDGTAGTGMLRMQHLHGAGGARVAAASTLGSVGGFGPGSGGAQKVRRQGAATHPPAHARTHPSGPHLTSGSLPPLGRQPGNRRPGCHRWPAGGGSQQVGGCVGGPEMGSARTQMRALHACIWQCPHVLGSSRTYQHARPTALAQVRSRESGSI